MRAIICFAPVLCVNLFLVSNIFRLLPRYLVLLLSLDNLQRVVTSTLAPYLPYSNATI